MVDGVIVIGGAADPSLDEGAEELRAIMQHTSVILEKMRGQQFSLW